MGPPFFELRGITKYFSRVVANRDVSFSLERGQVLALLGENGAGKSTVMKILYGLYQADKGHIFLDGEERRIRSPREAIGLGIAMIQQHFSLVMAHSVTENILLGNVKGLTDRRACEESVGKIAAQYGFELDPGALVESLSVGERQKVEILKALYTDARLLIMDEPTAVLTPGEAETLMAFVRDFTARGNAVVFITHKLKEVMEVADRIVVMRAGEVCGNLARADTDERELSRLMIGRELEAAELEVEAPCEGEPCLVLDEVTVRDREGMTCLDRLSLTVRRGEVLGVAGVAGNGQRELCETAYGVIRPESGRIVLGGKDMTHSSIWERIEAGMGYVPGDRHRDGMIAEMTLSENMLLKHHSDDLWTRRGLIDAKALDAYTTGIIGDYKIKAPGAEVGAGGLSGGNQQKLVVGREVERGRRLLIFDQPTRGLDLGAMDYVHRVILRERAMGKGILLVSTELSELFALADRIVVLYKGRIQGEGGRHELDAESVGLMMAGYGRECEATP